MCWWGLAQALQFRGREMSHKELGLEIVEQIPIPGEAVAAARRS